MRPRLRFRVRLVTLKHMDAAVAREPNHLSLRRHHRDRYPTTRQNLRPAHQRLSKTRRRLWSTVRPCKRLLFAGTVGEPRPSLKSKSPPPRPSKSNRFSSSLLSNSTTSALFSRSVVELQQTWSAKVKRAVTSLDGNSSSNSRVKEVDRRTH